MALNIFQYPDNNGCKLLEISSILIQFHRNISTASGNKILHSETINLFQFIVHPKLNDFFLGGKKRKYRRNILGPPIHIQQKIAVHLEVQEEHTRFEII